jgi:hypothetical protein
MDEEMKDHVVRYVWAVYQVQKNYESEAAVMRVVDAIGELTEDQTKIMFGAVEDWFLKKGRSRCLKCGHLLDRPKALCDSCLVEWGEFQRKENERLMAEFLAGKPMGHGG